jgi:hypothetical protein
MRVKGDKNMQAKANVQCYAWMEDGDMPADAGEPIEHRSTQVAGQPGYVADICNRFAGEKSEEERKPCVIRGYN